MPELPEVETYASHLQCLVGLRVLRPRFRSLTPTNATPRRVAHQIRGALIVSVWRRGKYLVVDLSNRMSLVVHPRMTGRFLILDVGEPPSKFWRFHLSLSDGLVLCFDDMRRFGTMSYVPTTDKLDVPPSSLLGPEPLKLSFGEFSERLSNHKGMLKPLLLNQHFMAGIGNIYADESLFQSGVHPQRKANTLNKSEQRRLLLSIKRVLRAAISAGGSSVSDYLLPNGEMGNFQNKHSVYQRTGKPCKKCATPIQRTVIAQRGTHFCPKCQPL